MERASQVQLNNALTATETASRPLLPPEESIQLSLIVDQMQTRYWSQDTAEPVEGILWDLERLVVRHSFRKVADALAELRIKPGQIYFPRPDEVAGEIERQQEGHNRAADTARQRQARATAVAEFWRWAPGWMEITGNNEDELLNRFPSYRGTKPQPAQ